MSDMNTTGGSVRSSLREQSHCSAGSVRSSRREQSHCSAGSVGERPDSSVGETTTVKDVSILAGTTWGESPLDCGSTPRRDLVPSFDAAVCGTSESAPGSRRLSRRPTCLGQRSSSHSNAAAAMLHRLAKESTHLGGVCWTQFDSQLPSGLPPLPQGSGETKRSTAPGRGVAPASRPDWGCRRSRKSGLGGLAGCAVPGQTSDTSKLCRARQRATGSRENSNGSQTGVPLPSLPALGPECGRRHRQEEAAETASSCPSDVARCRQALRQTYGKAKCAGTRSAPSLPVLPPVATHWRPSAGDPQCANKPRAKTHVTPAKCEDFFTGDSMNIFAHYYGQGVS